MREGGITGQNKVSNAAIGLVDIKDRVAWQEGVRGDDNVVCLRNGVMCERVAVVLWARWIQDNVWRGDLEMIVSDMDGNVGSKFKECGVVCFEVEVEETTDSNGAYGKSYDGLS